MPPTPTNRFGRRPGRGRRPFILLPKLIALALFVGSLASLLIIWFGSAFTSLPPADPRRLLLLRLISLLVRFLTIPALLAALLFGLALFLQHPRQFIRMRWLIVKLATLAILMPAAHLFLYTRMELLRDAFAHHTTNPPAESQFAYGFATVLAISIFVVILGRLKPRLGQNWAQSYAASLPSGPDTTP
ncbi:MAG: hypothetical protein NTU53_04925 [Planctomycetota bacterium]|nr:hypothetical protein [Planctomycetota bacterium]